MILSAVMMLDYLKEHDAARKVENALMKVLYERKVVTCGLWWQCNHNGNGP